MAKVFMSQFWRSLTSRLMASGVGLLMIAFFAPTSLAQAPLRPWQGHQRALVLLIEWSNRPMTVDPADVEATFFGTDGSSTSMKDFFQENTHGAFELSGDVLPWRRSALPWNPSADCSLGPIVDAAWRLFAGQFNVSDYDSNGDGKVDNLFVVHSGRISSDRVGPECTFVSDARSNFTAVFQSQGLGSIGSAIPIGFYLHEGGHGYYNLPDLYADHYNGRYGIAMWGIMGLGAWGVRHDISTDELFRFPAHFEPYSKVQIGWVTPRVISTTTRHVQLKPIETNADIIRVPSGNASYYLEYRSDYGFSAGHLGHGLLLWKNHTLIQADGRDDLNHGTPQGRRPLPPILENFGDDSDPFPGSLGVTTYSNTRDGVRFENIEMTPEMITLDIVITNAAATDLSDRYLDPWQKDEQPAEPAGAIFDGTERL